MKKFPITVKALMGAHRREEDQADRERRGVAVLEKMARHWMVEGSKVKEVVGEAISRSGTAGWGWTGIRRTTGQLWCVVGMAFVIVISTQTGH